MSDKIYTAALTAWRGVRRDGRPEPHRNVTQIYEVDDGLQFEAAGFEHWHFFRITIEEIEESELDDDRSWVGTDTPPFEATSS